MVKIFSTRPNRKNSQFLLFFVRKFAFILLTLDQKIFSYHFVYCSECTFKRDNVWQGVCHIHPTIHPCLFDTYVVRYEDPKDQPHHRAILVFLMAQVQ